MGTETLLPDGTRVRIRPMRPSDVRWILPAFRRLSPRTIYQRFFTPLKEMDCEYARHLTNVDHHQREALVAEVSKGISYQPAGVARYEPTSEAGVAEVALLVADQYQHRGVGRVLFDQILQSGVRNGIRQFCADILGENERMLRLLRSHATILKSDMSQGVTHCVFTPKVI